MQSLSRRIHASNLRKQATAFFYYPDTAIVSDKPLQAARLSPQPLPGGLQCFSNTITRKLVKATLR